MNNKQLIGKTIDTLRFKILSDNSLSGRDIYFLERDIKILSERLKNE